MYLLNVVRRYRISGMVAAAAILLTACAVPGLPAPIAPPPLPTRPAVEVPVMDQWCKPIPVGGNYVWSTTAGVQDPVTWDLTDTVHDNLGWVLTDQPAIGYDQVTWFAKGDIQAPRGSVGWQLKDGTCRTDKMQVRQGTFDNQPAYRLSVPRYAGEVLVFAWIVPA